MYRSALAQDLSYLHQSLKKQRFPSPAEQPEARTADPSTKEQAFFVRLRELPRLRSLEEHIDGIDGLPLDAVQLLLRSEFPSDELARHPKIAATIIKAQHDLHFWEPLETLGLSQSFHLHRQALQADAALIKANRPPLESAALRAAWKNCSRRLQKALQGAI